MSTTSTNTHSTVSLASPSSEAFSLSRFFLSCSHQTMPHPNKSHHTALAGIHQEDEEEEEECSTK